MSHPTPARTRRSFLVAPALLLLLACGGGGGGGSNQLPPATADFALQLSPANLQIPAGGSGFVTVTLSRLNGFTAAVTLAGTDFPTGVAAAGTIPAGASTLQLPIAIAPDVTASSYSGLIIRGQAGSLVRDAPFALTVAPALPASHLRADLVQAAGGRQTNGAIENHAVAGEGLPAQLVQDANDSTRVRQAFLPSGTPTDH